jgi:hypothetical protein
MSWEQSAGTPSAQALLPRARSDDNSNRLGKTSRIEILKLIQEKY